MSMLPPLGAGYHTRHTYIYMCTIQQDEKSFLQFQGGRIGLKSNKMTATIMLRCCVFTLFDTIFHSKKYF